MFDIKRCPDADELKLMLLGQLSPNRSAEVENHLDDCPRCLTLVGNIEIESQIMDALKAQPVGAVAGAMPADLDRLMTTLDSLHPAFLHDANDAPSQPNDTPLLALGETPDELGRLAHFRILERIGSGGMGVVYKADDTKLQRTVALKVLRPRIARDTDARARFLREARAVASIKHDHVVTVHDVGEAPTSTDLTIPYIAMELLDGTSLQAWMQTHRRPPVLTVVRLGRQIAEALAAIHARGLVHRDVKPGNLWLEPPHVGDASVNGALPAAAADNPGKLKLLDFGLASTSTKAVAEAEARMLGTPAYMAPEQFRGDSVDPRSDMFGLGCILYELCAGEHPFPDRRICAEHTPPLPVNDLNSSVPAELSKLIGRMLSEDPDRRPESVRRIVRELTEIEKSLENSAARPHRMLRRVGFAVAGLAMAAMIAAVAYRANQPAPPALHAGPPKKSALEEEWYAEIRKMPSKQQWIAVTQKLAELNPGYVQDKAAGWVEPEAVLRFSETTDNLTDIRPLSCLVDLKTVARRVWDRKTGKLTDLSPLASLRLHKLQVIGNLELRDLSPLRGMPLFDVDVSDTGVESLNDLVESPVVDLRFARTKVSDLKPLRSIPTLRLLDFAGCPIETIQPIASLAVDNIRLDYQPERDRDVLQAMKSLKRINGMTATEFWKKNP